VRVISRRKLREFWDAHKASETPLKAWFSVAKGTTLRDFGQLKAAFGAATDQVGPFVVFDIGGNKFRLIAIVNYRRRIVFVRHLFTHKEYDRCNEKRRDKEAKQYAQLVKEYERLRAKKSGEEPGREKR
jgi:mRNA interferase HigB